ncbi:hypothetical protein N7491_006571, partial [Penicillium cf. griseofulvum]
ILFEDRDSAINPIPLSIDRLRIPPLSLLPPSANPCVPANDIPTTCDKTKSWIDNRILSGDNEEPHLYLNWIGIIRYLLPDTNGLSGDLGRYVTTTETVNNSNHTALNILQSCSVSLGNDRIQRILEAEAYLLV